MNAHFHFSWTAAHAFVRSEGRMEIVSEEEPNVVGVNQLVESAGVLLLPEAGRSH